MICADTLVDSDWEFAEGMRQSSKEDWMVKSWDNAGLRKRRRDNIKRILGYFIHAFELFYQRKRYNKIVCWQQFYGLIFAWYCCVFHVKKVNRLIVMTFIYKEKTGWAGILYDWLVRTAVKSQYIDKLVVFSKAEIGFYAKKFEILTDKLEYLPLGIAREKQLEKTKMNLPERFFLSVGRSNRDYDFLFQCAKEIEETIVVLTDSIKKKNLPSNVILYDNIRGIEYRKILNECYAVLIPLKDSNISSGQLVMLQAMQSKKPIIITEARSVSDYVKNDETALVCRKEKEDFTTAVKRISEDENLYHQLAENGYKKYRDCFSLFELGRNAAGIAVSFDKI